MPVFRDVDKKSIFDLSAELETIGQKARDEKLMPNEMQGGSMTILNLGGIGGKSFSPVVNAPEVAILGVCCAEVKPVWDGDDFVPRLMLPIDMTYDHRVIDGADRVRFTKKLCELLGDIRQLLL